MSCLSKGEMILKLRLELLKLKWAIKDSEKAKQREIRNLKEDHSDDFINSASILAQNKAMQESQQIWVKLRIMFSNFEKFVRAAVIFSLKKAAFCSEAYSFGELQYQIEIVEENGEFFEVQKLISSGLVRTRSFSITNFVNSIISASFIPRFESFFGDILKAADSDVFNLLMRTRDQAIYYYFNSLKQIFNLSSKDNEEAFYQKDFDTFKRNVKPQPKSNKNAYPCLFKWATQMILNINVENQEEKAEQLLRNRDQMIKETISGCEEEIWQLRYLKKDDFVEAVQHWNNLILPLSDLKEKLKLAGIDEDMIRKYHNDYQRDPSFKKIYKLQDRKEVSFWIIAMAVILKELPLGSAQLENGSLMFWILQNSNAGLKLKMNLWNLEMRTHYYHQIQEAQNTLLRKFDGKNILLKEMLEMIEENPHKPKGDACKRRMRAKRPTIQNLREEELIHKVRVSNRRTLTNVIVSQQEEGAMEKFIEKTVATYDGYEREFMIEQNWKAKQALEKREQKKYSCELEHNSRFSDFEVLIRQSFSDI